jgi:molybdate/tungstate transport system substrate-binding protein
MFVRKVVALALIGFAMAALTASPAAAASGNVQVYYAASLLALNNNSIGPAFADKTGYDYEGFPLGSQTIVNELKAGQIMPDVVQFADASLNAQLMGDSNNNLEKWYVTWAKTKLVIGFNPNSQYAADFVKVQQGKIPWYKALEQSGLRFGRTDPNADPKGYRIIMSLSMAQAYYNLNHFVSDILGPIDNPDPTGANSHSPEVFPEATLVSQLSSGNLDAGTFYLPEAKAAGIDYINLPAKFAFGSQSWAWLDATQRYTGPNGVTITGSPIVYTMSIPSTVQNENGAVAFCHFVLSSKAKKMGKAIGLGSVPTTVYGDADAVPPGVL